MKELLWYDRKRLFGLPLTFTRYFLFEDKLVHSKGILITNEGEIILYRVMDVEIKYSLIDRLFGVGTIVLYGGDVTDAKFEIEKVKNPREVLDLINELIENERMRLGLKGRELFGAMSNPNLPHPH